MRIEQRSAGWYLSVDGGTDGGDPAASECRGPFPQRPELLRKMEEKAIGASGERLLTVTSAFQAGEHVVTVREQYWLSPLDAGRVKLLELFDVGGRSGGDGPRVAE